MIKIQTLSSGSGGNIIYVGDNTTHILIDVGLPLSQTLKRLQEAHIKPTDITAILVTHEHSDHVAGLCDFVLRYGTKIYTTAKAKHILKVRLNLPEDYFIPVDDMFNIGEITINIFPVPHDSQFCFGYTFTAAGVSVGLATDIGKMTPTILSHLAGCEIVVLECNHCPNKLHANTKYPPWLKRRIISPHGHLSNTECGHAIAELHKHSVGQVILAHLSEQNNSPTLAYTMVKDFLQTQGITEGKDIFIDVAPQHQVGNLYCID